MSRREQRRQEFDEFVVTSSTRLLRTAYLVVWDAALAEDLVQECLSRVARRWSRVSRMEHPEAYARRVLVNLALDGARRRHRHREELVGAEHRALAEHADETAGAQIGMVETSEVLRAALATLAPRQRATLVLRYFEDLSEADTAAVLGCSVGTVKSTTSRAIERLRETLGRSSAVMLVGPNVEPPATFRTTPAHPVEPATVQAVRATAHFPRGEQ